MKKRFCWASKMSVFRACSKTRCLLAFVRSNPVVSDPRVDKEVQSLLNYGYRVMVLGWDREGTFEHSESEGNKEVFRFGIKAPYNKPVLVFYYPLFWLWVLFKLLRYRPAVIHLCDLDSSLPGVLCKLLVHDTKIILDVFDTYTLLVEQKSKLLAKFIRPLERYVASISDAFITVSENRLGFFRGVNLKVTGIVMNCPPLSNEIPSSSHNEEKEGRFRIVYAGTVSPRRGLFEVAEAIKGLDNVEFLVAGRIVNNGMAKELRNYPNVRYVGQLSFSRSLELQKNADVIPLLYDCHEPINRVASPNKLFEAMMLGVPVITNLSSSLIKVPFSVQVEYDDIAGIRKAITFLKESPEERANLGLLGKLAYDHEYNWSIMERRLLEIYDKVLSPVYGN